MYLLYTANVRAIWGYIWETTAIYVLSQGYIPTFSLWTLRRPGEVPCGEHDRSLPLRAAGLAATLATPWSSLEHGWEKRKKKNKKHKKTTMKKNNNNNILHHTIILIQQQKSHSSWDVVWCFFFWGGVCLFFFKYGKCPTILPNPRAAEVVAMFVASKFEEIDPPRATVPCPMRKPLPGCQWHF